MTEAVHVRRELALAASKSDTKQRRIGSKMVSEVVPYSNFIEELIF